MYGKGRHPPCAKLKLKKAVVWKISWNRESIDSKWGLLVGQNTGGEGGKQSQGKKGPTLKTV